jgi:hypothetical protein
MSQTGPIKEGSQPLYIIHDYNADHYLQFVSQKNNHFLSHQDLNLVLPGSSASVLVLSAPRFSTFADDRRRA